MAYRCWKVSTLPLGSYSAVIPISVPSLNRSPTNPDLPITNVILWEKCLPTATVQSISLTGNQSLPLQEHFKENPYWIL